MKRKLKITGGPHGLDTIIILDGIEQKMLTAVTLILQADETNKVILEYANIDVDIDVEMDEDDVVEEVP